MRRYRLSPFGRFFLICLLSAFLASIIESFIEDQYLKEISKECQKNGFYKTRKIDMDCKINLIKI